MDFIHHAMSILTDLPTHLNAWAASMGPWFYILLFAIIFCETGLVIAPILPGDSLLFAVGALAASDASPINVWTITGLLIVAAITGNMLNYQIGQFVAPRVAKMPRSKLFNPEYVARTEAFFAKHGGKTIIITRFAPILRTYAPFVAGLGAMKYWKFSLYNAIGGIAWVGGFILAGFYFGNIPSVKSNFHLVIIAICVVTVLPAVIEAVRAQKNSQKNSQKTSKNSRFV